MTLTKDNNVALSIGHSSVVPQLDLPLALLMLGHRVHGQMRLLTFDLKHHALLGFDLVVVAEPVGRGRRVTRELDKQFQSLTRVEFLVSHADRAGDFGRC